MHYHVSVINGKACAVKKLASNDKKFMRIFELAKLFVIVALASFLESSHATTDQASGKLALDRLSEMPIVNPVNHINSSLILGAFSSKEVLLEIPNKPHIFILDANAVASMDRNYYRQLIEKSLKSSGTVVLAGKREVLLDLKPHWLRMWPDAETVVLTSRMGTRVDGIRGHDIRDLKYIVKYIARHVDSARKAESMSSNYQHSSTLERARRSVNSGGFTKSVAFSMRPSSPVETCTDFGNNLLNSKFERPLTEIEHQALSFEISSWCQSGSISNYQAAKAPYAVPRWEYTDKPMLSLLTEWALIRSEDIVVPNNSKYYLWVKSIGQGAGSGFTRRLQDTAKFRNNIMYGLLDATIHAGWGRTFADKSSSWTYPLGQDDWSNSDPNLFGCDFGDAGSACPSSANVVHLFPSDTFNNQVSVSQSTALSIGGAIGVKGISAESESSSSIGGINASFNVSRTDSVSQSVTVNLTSVQTSSAKAFSRSTRWRPDVPAIWDYLISRSIVGDFGTATPTASTLNPEYDVIWQFPARKNEGKVMKFSLIYEAGWNNCVREVCAISTPPPDKTIPAQKRVYWSDSILIDLRTRSLNNVFR
ncbi:hypothetical protein [Burkholderia ubonensis]|uniref:hypothetical protein n=1 Tax=Burkholderia ubonensis TaxID=101571 RepID=UPI000AEBCD34|nr:hypothetical protein [Burkholderia ubonensis]